MLKTKTITLLLANLMFSSVFSQGQLTLHQDLKWSGLKKNIISDNQEVNFISLENAMYDYVNQKVTPFLHISRKWYNSEANIEITNLTYSDLSVEEASTIDVTSLTSEVKINSEVNYSRGQAFLQVDIYPFFIDKNGQIKKVNSFDLVIEKGDPIQITQRQNQRLVFANESVLLKGDWYKIGILKDGIYKITYNNLKDLGIDIDNISPDAINVYGNSFGMLPELNSTYRPDDLLKNNIFIQGDGDGSFDSQDYILFYGKGPDTWKVNGNNFEHTKNYFCDTSYFFICVDTSNLNPKRIGSINSASGGTTHTVTTFNDYRLNHNDYYNLMKSGREWLGDHYDIVTNYSYPFSFSNLDLTSSQRIRMALAAKTPGSGQSSFTVDVPEASFNTTTSIFGVGSGSYPYHAIYAGGGQVVYTVNSTSPSFNINLTFNKFSASSEGWLDWIEVNARRNLIFVNPSTEFKDLESVGTGNIAEYFISSMSSSINVWEITDPTNANLVNGTLAGTVFSFKAEADSLRSFVAFNPGNLSSPILYHRINNQNLHGLGYADLLIVTHPSFLSQANDLAAIHQSDGMSAHVVTCNEIYNEFSSGMKDITAIRMFFKMFYDRAGGDTTLMPKYAVLFGDGSYDNKYRLAGNSAFIPTYQNPSVGNMYIITSFTSDDYFAILDDNESMAAGNLMDIAIGRIPVRSTSEANAVLNKIRAYNTEVAPPINEGCCDNLSPANMGDWRNYITLVADDEDYNAYINPTDGFAEYIETNYPDFLMKKIYLDAYLQSSTPGGKRYYEAEKDFRNRVQDGALLVNYMGHGGEVGLAHERVLDLATINGWTNAPRLPVFMTATCEFSRFDDPARTSAGEYVLLNPEGGGVSLMTTTRVVISGPNEQLNRYFIDIFLNRGPNYERQKLGDLYLASKNKMATISPTNNTRNFTLLGDPALDFRVPFHNIKIDSLNGVHINNSPDTLKALSLITLKGHIEDEAGNALNNFNGIVSPMVFDKEQTITTLANDAPLSIAKNFNVYKNIIYKGKSTVSNGQFEFTFVVPKDISFQYGNGKLSFYAQNGNVDANGYNKDIIVGGSNNNAPVDNVGPDLDIYMNDLNFVNGGTTNTQPYLIVKVSDENGLNTVGNGIGHDLTGVLDGNTSNTINLNDYYEADLDTYKSGRIKYQLTGLEPGSHTIKVKVWDVYNNSSEKELEFIVQDEQEIKLDHLLNYPNPFTTYTEFMFEHNQTCQSLDVQLMIMTVSGKVVKTINQTVNTEGFRVTPIPWDGLDDYGDKLAIGTYIYKIKVKAEDKVIEQYEKLVILR